MTNDTHELRQGVNLQNGKYQILSVIGQGGFGITYLAEQTGLGMRVAIKEFFMKGSCLRDANTSNVSVPVTDNQEVVRRCRKKFIAEARKIASLNNDHIVNIIDVFDENGTSYYVMKYLSGGSLASVLLKEGAFSEEAALTVIKDISDALNSIHSNGLLHLDIKPANILFDERGRAVLIDFGVSKYMDSQQDTDTTSSLIGFSRGFAPLEQVNSTVSSLSPATDIYALGATLYDMVTGKTPPEASIVMESGLSGLPSGISNDTRNAIIQAMLPRRRERPQTIGSFLSLLPSSDDTVLVKSYKDKTHQIPRRNKGTIPLFISAIILVIAIGLVFVALPGRDRATESLLKKDNKELKAETDRLNTLNESLQNEIKSLNSKLSSNATISSKNKELEKKVKEVESQNTTLSKENARLKKEVNSYKPDAERWRRQLQQDSF